MEGTTGIQALDLLGRKILMTQRAPKRFTKVVHKFCSQKPTTRLPQEFVTAAGETEQGVN